MRRDDDSSVWIRTERTEEIRRAVDAAALTLVVGAPGTGKTTLARMLASDTRKGRTVLTPEMRGRDFDEVERQVRGELGQGRPGDLVILDG